MRVFSQLLLTWELVAAHLLSSSVATERSRSTFGPENCVHVFREEGVCVLQADCAQVGEARVHALRPQFLCRTGSSWRSVELPGQLEPVGALRGAETCDACAAPAKSDYRALLHARAAQALHEEPDRVSAAEDVAEAQDAVGEAVEDLLEPHEDFPEKQHWEGEGEERREGGIPWEMLAPHVAAAAKQDGCGTDWEWTGECCTLLEELQMQGMFCMMALEHAGKGEDHPADTVEWLCGEPSCVPQLSESLREVRWKRGVLCSVLAEPASLAAQVLADACAPEQPRCAHCDTCASSTLRFLLEQPLVQGFMGPGGEKHEDEDFPEKHGEKHEDEDFPEKHGEKHEDEGESITTHADWDAYKKPTEKPTMADVYENDQNDAQAPREQLVRRHKKHRHKKHRAHHRARKFLSLVNRGVLQLFETKLRTEAASAGSSLLQLTHAHHPLRRVLMGLVRELPPDLAEQLHKLHEGFCSSCVTRALASVQALVGSAADLLEGGYLAEPAAMLRKAAPVVPSVCARTGLPEPGRAVPVFSASPLGELCLQEVVTFGAEHVAPVAVAGEHADEGQVKEMLKRGYEFVDKHLKTENVCAMCGLPRARAAVGVGLALGLADYEMHARAHATPAYYEYHGKAGVRPREDCVGKVGWDALFLRCDEGFAAGAFPGYAALDEPSVLNVGWWELGAACAVDPHKERDVCLDGNLAEMNLMAAAATDEALAPDAAARATKAAEMHHQSAETAEALQERENLARACALAVQAGQCSELCRDGLAKAVQEEGCCAKHRTAQRLLYGAPMSAWAALSGAGVGLAAARQPGDADQAVVSLAALCSLPELIECGMPDCGAVVELAVPVSGPLLWAGYMPLLEAGLRNDLAAGTSEEKSAFRLDHLALTEADGETFLEAKAVVLLQPCSRAAAVAEAVQAQVKSGALAFPSLREGGAPPTPSATRQLRGVLVLAALPEDDPEDYIAGRIAGTLNVAPSAVTVKIPSAAALLQVRTRQQEHSAIFTVEKEVSVEKAAEMKSALLQAVSAGSEGPLGLALVPGRSLVNVHATDGAQAALLPVPAPVARKPPPAAVVKQDLGASAMVPAAAAVAAVLLALLQV